jgi:Tol biopolymer transport system component
MDKKKSARRKMSPQDLFHLRIITGIALSPDEKLVAYCVERMDQEANKYFKNVFMLDVRTRKSGPFTHGEHSDGLPVWSHDGSRLAFVSTRDKKTGIYLMPSAGGAEQRLLEIDGTISSVQWTPDDNHLVFALRYNDSHFIKDEKKKSVPPVYRHITRLMYRMDGEGFLPQDQFHVYAVDVKSAELRQITKGDRDTLFPAVSPDGRWVAFVSNRAKNPYIESLLDDLFLVPFRGGKERKIPTPAGPMSGLRFSPDGKKIAYLGHDNPTDAWGVTNLHVWTVGVTGHPEARDLMPTFDRMAIDQSIHDTADAHGEPHIEWSADGKRIFFACGDTGTSHSAVQRKLSCQGVLGR